MKLPPFDFSKVDRSRPFWYYYTFHIRRREAIRHLMIAERDQRVVVTFSDAPMRFGICPGDEFVRVDHQDVLGRPLGDIDPWLYPHDELHKVEVTLRRWISVDRDHVWEDDSPQETRGSMPSKEALEMWPRLQAEPQREPSDELVEEAVGGGGGAGGAGGGNGEEGREESPALASAASAAAAAAATTAVAPFGSDSASVAAAGDASSSTSTTPGLKSPDPSDGYVVGTDGRVPGQPSIPRSGSTTPNSRTFNPSATARLPTGSDGQNDHGHEDDLPISNDDDEVGFQYAGDDVASKSESYDAKPPPRPSTANVEPSLGGTAAAAANNTGIMSNSPDIVAHGSAKPSASTTSTNRSSSGTTPNTTTTETASTSNDGALSSSPIECLRDRVWEARLKQVGDAEKFLEDKGVHDAKSLPDAMPMDHDAFLPRAKAAKKALEPFKDDADCPFVDTYRGKIKNLTSSQLHYFLYCIEENFRFLKNGGEASHGSIDEDFLKSYLLSSSEKKAWKVETLEATRSISHTMDSNGFVDLSHAELHAQFIGGHACGVSAANSVFGRKVLRKSDVSESKGGLSLEQVTNAVRKGPLGISCEIKHDSRDVIRLQRESTSLGIDGVSRMKSIVNCKEGILLVSALASGAEKCSKVGHFFVVNGLMQSILDCQNGKGHCISYAGIDANNTAFVKKFFRAFNVIDIRRIYLVQVRVDRIPECFPSFVGSVNGVFYGIQPQRHPGPLDMEASNIDASYAKKNDGESLVSAVKMEGSDSKDDPKPLKRNTHTSKRKAADGDIEGAASAAEMAPCYRQNVMSKKARAI